KFYIARAGGETALRRFVFRMGRNTGVAESNARPGRHKNYRRPRRSTGRPPRIRFPAFTLRSRWQPSGVHDLFMKVNPIYSIPPAAALLTRLRKICSQLPDVSETVTFGHPTFKVAGKTFAVFEQYKGELGLALKVEKELQGVFLKDPRFYFTPYIGKQGWVT